MTRILLSLAIIPLVCSPALANEKYCENRAEYFVKFYELDKAGYNEMEIIRLAEGTPAYRHALDYTVGRSTWLPNFIYKRNVYRDCMKESRAREGLRSLK